MDAAQEVAFWQAHVTPAADCPHYIPYRMADAGIRTCDGCAVAPVSPAVKQNRGRPRARTGVRQRPWRAA